MFLDTNGVPFEKIVRADNTGADFKLKSPEEAKQIFTSLKKHKKIKRNFDMELPKNSNIIKIYYK